MKCRDCENLVWGYDEGERVWWCRKHGYCPDLDVERSCSDFSLKKPDIFTALSTLQAENAQLRESRDHWKRLAHELSEGVNGKDAEHERLQAENEKLRAELEQVKAERDAAVSWAQKYTESIDMPCVACKHNTGDYVCTAICGNCGPMGAESCKWEFDFSGELKED